MNLDDLSLIQQLDTQNMLGEIDNLPNQLEQAWALGQTPALPPLPEGGFKLAVICGMGGSAIGADLLAAYVADSCPVPVIVHRDYGLPACAEGPETLVITSSHSGNTEETLTAFDVALERGCTLVSVCTGGKLAQKAVENNVPVWTFSHKGQPRAAVGYSFGILLALFDRLGLVPPQAGQVASAVKEMKKQQASWGASVPAAQNPAKRYAGQYVGRWVSVYGAGILAPVARRWKGQINELAKAGANFEFLPEADHNALAGTLNPHSLLSTGTMTMFLTCAADHPRNRLRADLTRQGMMLEGLNTDFFNAPGETALAQMWSAILFGDYAAFYLAMAYGAEPTEIEALVQLKAALASHR